MRTLALVRLLGPTAPLLGAEYERGDTGSEVCPGGPFLVSTRRRRVPGLGAEYGDQNDEGDDRTEHPHETAGLFGGLLRGHIGSSGRLCGL